MKPLKCACFLLLMCCFLTPARAEAAPEVYVLEAILIDISGGDAGKKAAPELTVQLLQNGGEVSVPIAENCRFFETKHMQKPLELTFIEFKERFTGDTIEFDFVVQNKKDYLVLECRNVLVLSD